MNSPTRFLRDDLAEATQALAHAVELTKRLRARVEELMRETTEEGVCCGDERRRLDQPPTRLRFHS